MRFMPIDVVCGADIQSIRAAVALVLPRYFPADGPGVSFACQYEHRASKNLDRTEVIDTLATAVPKVRLGFVLCRPGGRGRTSVLLLLRIGHATE